MKTTLVLLVAFTILQCARARSLRLQKRAAFYIANETACVVDNIVYYNGDPIPTDDPCEACKCRPPGFACVLRECEVKPGCRAVRRAGHCCPEYICGCEHNGRMYRDGDEIRDSQNPCYTCHCQGSAIACAFVDCFFRVDCAPDYVQGECCPRYDHCPPLGPQSNESFIQKSTEVPTVIPTTLPAKEDIRTNAVTEEIAEGTKIPVIENEVRSDEKELGDNPSEEGKSNNQIPDSVTTETSEKQTEQPLGEKQNDDRDKPLIDATALFYIPKEDSNDGSENKATEDAEKESKEDGETDNVNDDDDDDIQDDARLESEDEKSLNTEITDKTTQKSIITTDDTHSTQSDALPLDQAIQYSEDSKTKDSHEQSGGESTVLSEIHDVQNYKINQNTTKDNTEATTEKGTEGTTGTILLKHDTLISVVTVTEPDAYYTSTGDISTKVTHETEVTTGEKAAAGATTKEESSTAITTEQKSNTDTTAKETVTQDATKNNLEHTTKLDAKISAEDVTSLPIPVLLNGEYLLKEKQSNAGAKTAKHITEFTESESKLEQHSSTHPSETTLLSKSTTTLSDETKFTATETSTTSQLTRHTEAINENAVKERNDSLTRMLKSESETENTEKTGVLTDNDSSTSSDTTCDTTEATIASEAQPHTRESNEKIDDLARKGESTSTEETDSTVKTEDHTKPTEENSSEKLPKVNLESTVQVRTTPEQTSAANTVTSPSSTDKEQSDKTTVKAENTQTDSVDIVKGLEAITTLSLSE